MLNKKHGSGKRLLKDFKTGKICLWYLQYIFGCYDSVEQHGDSRAFDAPENYLFNEEIRVAHSVLPRGVGFISCSL